MDSTDIEIFLTVARTGNVSLAGQHLHSTQSALSKRLKNLEAELGVSLFFRGKGRKNVELTHAGTAFMEMAMRWQGIWQDMHSLGGLQGGTSLKIGILDSLMYELVLPLLTELRGREPGISLRLLTRHSAEMYDEIDKRAIDVGFSLLDRTLPGVRRRRLFSEPFVALIAEQGDDEEGQVATKDLDAGQEVYLPWWSPGYLAWHEGQWDLARSQRISVSSTHLMLDLLGPFGSWAIMPYSMALRARKQRGFTLCRISPEPPPRICYLLTHKETRSGIQKSLRLFHSCLQLALKRELPWARVADEGTGAAGQQAKPSNA